MQRLQGPALVATEPTGVDESAYRTIIDAVAQLMWVNDAGGGVRFFNRFGTEYMGRTNAELEGRQWLAYIHDDAHNDQIDDDNAVIT